MNPLIALLALTPSAIGILGLVVNVECSIQVVVSTSAVTTVVLWRTWRL